MSRSLWASTRVASLVPVLLLGCSAANFWDDPGPESATEDVIEAPVDVVWDALPRVYGFLGMQPITEADRASRSILSVRTLQVRDGIVGSRDEPLARCSAPPTAQRTDDGGRLNLQSINGLATASVQTRLAAEGEATRMRSQVTASVDPVAAPAPARVPLCVTTGRLESQIAEGVRSVVSPPDSILEPSERRGPDRLF